MNRAYRALKSNASRGLTIGFVAGAVLNLIVGDFIEAVGFAAAAWTSKSN